MKKLILASSSPRRKELLEQIGAVFEIIPASGEEIIAHTDPSAVVKELSMQKALEIYHTHHFDLPAIILGADTVVVYQDHILGKPQDNEDAFQMLRSLQGNVHSVFTGITFIDSNSGNIHTECCQTLVHVYPMSDQEINEYIATGESLDKAGAYGIQGHFAAYIKKIDGDYYNVVGLPISMVYQYLKNDR